ncbi:MAG TPA: CPBP family intramembrane glutamic endopeptidase [Candidatus Polarisedimenticolia bacterium]|nr:CPBP family intramembrane glutamic endopeptidase [Candidatus Polarisedimenticolia bacterium]
MQAFVATTPSPSRGRVNREPVAPAWHTAVFILIVIGVAVLDVRRLGTGRVPLQINRFRLYSTSVVFELVMLGYVWLFGLRRTGKRLGEIIGGKWIRWTDPLRDFGIAILFWLTVGVVLTVLRATLGVKPDDLGAMKILFPRGAAEMVAWAFVSVTAGFCEEILFRGYLQRQFLALTGRPELAIVIQAVVFGMAHAYQGWKGAVSVAVYGAMFGILAVMRNSLRPGMMQHAMQDSFSGIVGSLLTKKGYI